MNFIDIIQTNDEEPRSSTLGISKNYPDSLMVLGVLPHNYTFRPKTASDRDNLIHWLKELNYS